VPANQILKCVSCNKYTLEKHCACGGEAIIPKPAKWSPEDKYAKYRLDYKKKNN